MWGRVRVPQYGAGGEEWVNKKWGKNENKSTEPEVMWVFFINKGPA